MNSEIYLFKNMSKDELKSLLPILLADDSRLHKYQENSYQYKSFQPFSFTLSDRISNRIPLNGKESCFTDWLYSLIEDFIDRFPDKCNNHISKRNTFAKKIFENFTFLLNLKYHGSTVASSIWNQEAPDLLTKVALFTMGIDPTFGADKHAIFNELAFLYFPAVIKKLGLDSEKSLEVLLRYSIASGLCGLDLKGAVAAASEFAQPGIPMKHLSTKKISENEIERLCEELEQKAQGAAPLFHLDDFISDISLKPCLVSWFTDDVIESFFDLLFIQQLLLTYKSLSLAAIPKNGKHANDLSWTHLEAMMKLPIFKDLSELSSSNRFFWIKNGPRMSTVSLHKLSPEANKLLQESDIAVIKGCRSHEMVQGGLKIPSYTGYIVARSFSEIVCGFDATQAPLLFFRLDPERYSYYGFSIRNINNPTKMKDGRSINTVLSTTKKHFDRKELKAPREIMDEMTEVVSQIKILPGREKNAAVEEANDLAEKLVHITRETYCRMADIYEKIRWEEPHDLDKKLWRKLLAYTKRHVNKGLLENENKYFYLLDIGTGNGRDLKYAQNDLELQVVGIDNAITFVEKVKQLELDGKLQPNSIIHSDMRDLSRFQEDSFDIVRHNASLLHMPVIATDFMADLAITECHRVLKPFGILYILVKKGRGMDIVDTDEGLGDRFYQFYNKKSLTNLLQRNSFTILELSEEIEVRDKKHIPWLCAIATKS